MNDQELIDKIKSTKDSSALTELANRHTGLYMSVINHYSGYSRSNIDFDDLREDQYLHIYNWLMKYDPSKNMKFSTYVGENTKFMCMNLLRSINRKPIFETEDALLNIKSQDTTSLNCDLTDADNLIDDAESSKFKKIVKLRLEGKTWKEVGKKVSLSHEAARKKYLKNINKIQKYVKWSENIHNRSPA